MTWWLCQVVPFQSVNAIEAQYIDWGTQSFALLSLRDRQWAVHWVEPCLLYEPVIFIIYFHGNAAPEVDLLGQGGRPHLISRWGQVRRPSLWLRQGQMWWSCLWLRQGPGIWPPAMLALLSPQSLAAALRPLLQTANSSLGPWARAQGPWCSCAPWWALPQHCNRTSLHHKEHPWVHQSAHADQWFAPACVHQHQFWCY